MNDNVSWCQREDCDGPYVATDVNQKYCSKRCSRREAKRRQLTREEVENVALLEALKKKSQNNAAQPTWVQQRPRMFSISMNPRLSIIDEAEEIYRQLAVQQNLDLRRQEAERLTHRVAGSTPRSNQAYKDKQAARAAAKKDVDVFSDMTEKLGITYYHWQLSAMRNWFYRYHMREIWAKQAEERRNQTKTATRCVIDDKPGEEIHIFSDAMPNGLYLTPHAQQHVSVLLEEGAAIVETKDRLER